MINRAALLPMLVGIGMSIAITSTPSYAASFQEVPPPLTALEEGPPLRNSSSAGGSSGTAPAPVAPAGSEVGSQVDIEVETRSLRAQRRSAPTRPNNESTSISPLSPRLPVLDEFIATVKSAHAGAITGVYVPGLFALRVVPQPENRPTFVSFELGVATLFCGLGPCGSIGLLAHNQLSGLLFFLLSPQQDVLIIRGDGSTAKYRVSSIRTFQALRPMDPYSNYVDLNSRATLSSGELFQQIYGAGNQVVFQTCMAYGSDPTWGRLFVIADPVQG